MLNQQEAEKVLQEEIKKNPKVTKDDKYVTYNCPDCGAQVIADENTAATFCVYCGSVAILKSKLTGNFAPDIIIPFSKEKEDADKEFANLAKGRPLVPKSFTLGRTVFPLHTGHPCPEIRLVIAASHS